MMMDAKHTPLPWQMEVTNSTIWIGPMRPDGQKVVDIVCSFEYGDEYNDSYNARQHANAALIVHAVNNIALTAERDALQHDIERHLQIISDTLAERDRLAHALAFYADVRRYRGPNQQPIPDDPYAPDGLLYLYDTSRDDGRTARAALSPTQADGRGAAVVSKDGGREA